jgi:AcrR family transcriptional regulator
MATQAERREATRSRLIEAARQLFARDGYEATSTEAILAAAGVSRGGLYYHFPGKQDLFSVVFERVSREAIERSLVRTRAGGSPLAVLIEGSLAWLREARRREVAAILVDQGPRALGWRRARAIEASYSLGIVKRGVQAAVDAGEIEVESVTLTARLLNAVLAEAAVASLDAGGRLRVETVEHGVRQWIEGLAARRTS